MSNHGCMVTRETLHFGTQILTWVSFCRGLRSCLQQKVMLAVLWSDCSLFTLLWKDRYVLAELPLLVPSVLPLKICFGKIYGMHAFYWPLQLFSAQFLGNTLKCIVRYHQGAQVWNLLINFLPAHNVSPMLWHSHYCFRFFIMPFHLPVQSLNQKWGPREISSRIESAYRQKLPIESLLPEVVLDCQGVLDICWPTMYNKKEGRKHWKVCHIIPWYKSRKITSGTQIHEAWKVLWHWDAVETVPLLAHGPHADWLGTRRAREFTGDIIPPLALVHGLRVLQHSKICSPTYGCTAFLFFHIHIFSLPCQDYYPKVNEFGGWIAQHRKILLVRYAGTVATKRNRQIWNNGTFWKAQKVWCIIQSDSQHHAFEYIGTQQQLHCLRQEV